MSDKTPGVYHTDMLSALMNETLDEAGAVEDEATSASLHREVSLLRGILDQANVWLDVLDNQGNIVLWNQAAENISGYTREEVVGHGQIWDWLYPDPAYRQEIIEQAAAIIDGEAVQDFETTIQTKDGEARIISWYSRDITNDEGEHIGSIALGRDITDRRRAEQALEESEQQYRTIVEHAHDWIWMLDGEGRLTFANQAVQQGTGYDFSEQTGAHFSSFIHPDDLPHIREIFKQTVSGKHSSYTVRILDSEGRTVHLEVSSVPRRQGDEIVGTIAFARDVTEQVVLEDKLQESEERYRAMVEQSHDAVAIMQDEAFLFVNARLCELTGYSQDAFDDMNVGDIIHPEDRDRLEEMIHRRIQGETAQSTVQVKLRTEQGDIRHGEFSVTPIFYGGQTAVLASIRDVTERRRIEQRLRESEQRLRDLLETTSDCIWEIDTEGKYTFVSGSVEAVLGYTPDDLVGTSLFSLMPESEAQRMRQLFMEKATAREPLIDVENRNVAKNGDEVIMLTSAVPMIDDDGTLTGYRGIDKDVTEQKQAEAIARRQEKLSHLLLNATHDLGLLLDVDGTILTLNEAMAASLGVKREDVIQTKSSQYAQPGLFDPNIYADRMEKVLEVQRTGQPVQFEDNRKGRWFDSRFYPIFDEDGDVVQIAVFVRDITEQKRMERELKASEERYRNLVEHSVYGFYVMDPEGQYTYINPAGEEITGYSTDEIRGMQFSDLIVDEDLEHAIQDFEKVATGHPNEGLRRYRIRTKTGDIKTIEVNTIAVRDNGSITSLYGTAVDITEREQAVQNLRQSEQKYRELLEHANSVILRMDTDGNVTYFNEFAEQFFGWSEEEILGKNVVGTIVPETELSGRELRSIVDDIMSNPDEYVTNENENTRRNGEVVWMAWTNKVIYNDDGEVDEILCIGTDITERKRMEEELRNREKRYRDTVNLLPMPYGEFDREGNAVLLNQRCLELFQYTQEDFEEGLTVMQVLHPEDRERAGRNIKKVLQGEETAGLEYRFIKKDGTTFPCLVYSKPQWADGVITGFKSMLLDISQRKKMEQELRESEEKYATLVEQGNDGIMIVQDHLLKYCNGKLLKLTGYTMEEVQDTPFLQYMGAPFAAVARERYEKRMKGEDVPRMYEIEIISRDGQSIPVEVNASIIEYRGEPADMAIIRNITERKQMEEKIHRLSAAVEQSTEGYVITDMEGTVSYANSTIEQLYGYTPDELAGKPVFCLNAPSADTDTIRQELTDTGFWSGEVEQQRKDGSTFPALLSLFTVKNEKGEVDSAVASVRDITERKQMVENLKKNEEKFRSLAENATDGIYQVDENDVFVYVNDVYCKILGYTKEELLGKKYTMILFDKDIPAAKNITRNASEGKTQKGEFTLKTKKGDGVPVHFSMGPRLVGGNKCGFSGIIHDITERKRMERELKEQQTIAQTLLDATHDAALLADVDGTILAVNEAMADAMGDDRDAIVGSHMRDRIGAEAYVRRTPKVREVQRTKQPVQFVDEREGRIFSHRFYPVFDKDGEVQQVAVFSRDITERKRMEQELQESEERYRRLVEASPDSIIHVGLDGRILTANEKAAAVHGFATPEDMIGYDAAQFLQPEDRTRAREDIQRIMEEDPLANLEYTFLRSDGSPFQGALSLAVVRDRMGNPTGIIGITRDITERKQMEEDLKESEEKFRRLAEQSFDGIFSMDWRGVFTYVSPAVRRIAGYEPEEIEGTFFGRYIRKRDLPRLLKAVVDLKRGYSVEVLRYGLKRKDGTVAIVEINATPVMRDGKSVGIQGNIRDITERQQAEERYRRLVEASPELIAEADEEGRFVTVNPAMARALGCHPEDLIGRHASEVLSADVYQQRMAVLKEAIEHDTIVEHVDERAGRLYQNIVIPLEVPGRGQHVQVIARDITRRKKIEQALRESEEKFRSLFQHAPIGIALVDVEGRAVMSNPAFQDMLGYSEEELGSMRFPDFTHPDDVDKDLEMYWEVREGKCDEYTMEKRYIAKDGSVVWGNLTMSVVRGEDGKPLWGVGLVEDITERKQAEEEHQRQEQLAALGRIAAVVSHELNTPLANIALAADCLASECALKPCEELDVIHSEVDNASTIIKQVLGFSRMDEMELQPTDLAPVVTEAVDAVRDTTPFDGAIDVSVAAAGLLADEHQLYRAFVNLIKNAMLARDPDKESHHVTITSETTGNEVVVTIADTGVGMDSEIQAQADTPFFTTRPPGEGTGLGLYIARFIIERHGGTINIESEPGQGTMVTVKLPLQEEQA